MSMNAFLWALVITLLHAAGCDWISLQGDAPVASVKSSVGIAAEGSRSANEVSQGGRTAAKADASACAGALEALASCASAKLCTDISMYLPAASRDQLIALEGAPGYSEEAFDRYCINACQASDSRVDSALFQRDVCGAQVASPVTDQSDGREEFAPVVRAFYLRSSMKVGMAGVPLAAVVGEFGLPRNRSPTPHECGSAFSEGNIEVYDYADFTIETDGHTAIVRSMKAGNGNRIILSTGESIERLSEMDFDQAYGNRAEVFGDAYRTGISPGGDMESAYDFHFEDGQLARVDYWIGC